MRRGIIPLATRAPVSLLVALMLVRLTDEWFTFFPAGAIAPIKEDVGLSYAQAGIVLSALPAGGLLGHGFTVAADYVDRRLLAVGGALAQAICLAGFALSGSFAALVLVSFFWGAASDALVHGCEVALVDLYREQLAPALARVNMLGAIGDLLGPLTLAGAAAIGVGWRAVFIGAAVLMALYALLLSLHEFPPPHPPDDEGHTPLRGILAVLRDRRVLLLAVITGLFAVLDEPFWGFTIAYLEDVRGVSSGVANLVVTIGLAGGFAGFVAVPWITRRARGRTPLLALVVTLGLATAGVIIATVVPLLAIAAFLFGMSGAAFYTIVEATILGLRPGQAGTTGAVVSTIGLFGLAYPPLVGIVADAHGLTAGLSLYAAVPVVMALLLLLPTTAWRER